MSKDIFDGKGGMLTQRDNELLLDLFLVDWATTDHLWPLHFSACVRKRAYNRLRELHQDKRVLILRTVPVDVPGKERPSKLAFFALSKEARASVRTILERRDLTLARLFAETGEKGPERTNPEHTGLDRFEPSLADHIAKTTDVYVALKGTLLMSYGEVGEGWLWRNERRATIPYGDTSEHSYRPDAELLLDLPAAPGVVQAHRQDRFHLYFEVQTARSKKSRADVERRVTNHHLASQLHGFPGPDRRALVFIGESLPHVRAAQDAAMRLGIPALCGTEEEVLPQLRSIIAATSRGRLPDLSSFAGRGYRFPANGMDPVPQQSHDRRPGPDGGPPASSHGSTDQGAPVPAFGFGR